MTAGYAGMVEEGHKMSENSTVTQPPEVSPFGRLYTKAELCTLLGVKESWLNVEIAEGRIPHIRLGKRKFIRFSEENIREYLSSREFGSVDNFTD